MVGAEVGGDEEGRDLEGKRRETDKITHCLSNTESRLMYLSTCMHI